METIVNKNLRWMYLALILSVGGVLFVYLLTFEEQTLTVFERIHYGYLLLAFLLVCFMWIIEALRIKAILHLLGSPVSLLKVLEINLISNFAAAITPANTGGPPAQAYLLRFQGVPMEKSLTVVTVKLFLTLAFFSLLTPVLLLLYQRMLQFSLLVNLLFGAAILLIAVFLILGFYVLFKPLLVKRIVLFFLTKLPLKKWISDPEQSAELVYEKVKGFNKTLIKFLSLSRPERLLWIVFLTLIYWSLFFSIAPVLLLGLGSSPEMLSVLVRQVIFYFGISYIPLPGGSGVAELGLAGLFGPLIPSYLLAGFVGGWRFLTYHMNLIVGGLLVLRLAKRGIV